jgi:hypothetical protein
VSWAQSGVQAGSDCGMGSRVGHPENVWAKLGALADGARLAGERVSPQEPADARVGPPVRATGR